MAAPRMLASVAVALAAGPGAAAEDVGSQGKRHGPWPRKWEVLAPLAAPETADWLDAAEALHPEGVRGLWRRRAEPDKWARKSQARWQQLIPDEEGTVVFRLPAGAQAWALGQFKAKKSRCFGVKVEGTVSQAFVGDRLLPIGWVMPVQLTEGNVKVYLRLRGQGHAQFRFRAGSCAERLRLLDDSEDSPLPQVVGGFFEGALVHARVHNSAGAGPGAWLRGARLRLPPDENEDAVEAASQPPAVSLAPGQAASLLLRVRRKESFSATACPVTLNLRLEATSGLEEPRRITRRLQCRNATEESFLMSYVDADGSPQIAALRAPKQPCPAKGCPVLLSLHGMDVPAERQAYAYRPKEGAWVLAPHGRSKFAGLNWQNQGHRSAWRALDALAEQSQHLGPVAGGAPAFLADTSRVIFTGHSNGGFGALLLATERPDIALGVAPLAGMLSVHRAARGAGSSQAEGRVRALLEDSVAPYNLALVAGNIVGIPCLARTGAQDEVIPPSSTHALTNAITQLGGKCDAITVPGKGHWWWDTRSSMDGGAVDDDEMVSFWNKCFKRRAHALPKQFSIRCVSLDICGGRGGLRLLQQEEPFALSTVQVRRQQLWELATKNVLALGWAATSPLAAGAGIVVDGSKFEPLALAAAESLCRRAGSKKWHTCPSEAKCCSPPVRRTPAQAGPMRAVFDAALLAVAGGSGSAVATERHLDAAVAVANSRFAVDGGATQVALDSELPALTAGDVQKSNLLLLGGPDSNAWTAKLLQDGALPDLRFGPDGKVSLGPCDFDMSTASVMAVGPVPGGQHVFALFAANTTASLARLLAALAGFSEKNLWQVKLPDFLVLDAASSGGGGAGGIQAAGFWGGPSGWEWSGSRGFVACGGGGGRAPRAEL